MVFVLNLGRCLGLMLHTFYLIIAPRYPSAADPVLEAHAGEIPRKHQRKDIYFEAFLIELFELLSYSLQP